MQLALKRSLADEIFRSGDSDYMVSLARGLHVIQVFCEDERSKLTIADATRMSGLSRTVVARCLYTLQELGFVGRTGRYFYLLPKVLKLGYGYVSSASLPTLAQPIIEKLSMDSNAATAIVVLDREEVLYIAKAIPRSNRNVITINVNIGHRRPAYLTASGLALLASLKPEDFDTYIEQLDPAEVAKKAGRPIEDIVDIVNQTREQGFAMADLVFAKPMRALAVPVKNVVGVVVAAMVMAIYDQHSSNEELKERYLPYLRRAARKLSDKLIE